MAKSFRLDPELEERLAAVAARRGVPASVVIREAVRRECDEVLGQNLRAELGDLVGALAIGSGRSERTGDAFREILKARRATRQ